MKTTISLRSLSCFGLLLALGLLSAQVNAQGILLQGVGPVNRSMGGAATAAPINAVGALHWNPATISALPANELTFGFELLLPESEISSSVPALGLSGRSDSEPGVTPVPTIAWVHHSECNPRLTYGLGLYAIGGFSTNYEASTTNPVLFPQTLAPGVPGGLGRVYSEAQFLQIAPTVSIALTERLSVGFAPTVTMGKIMVDPLFFTAPDDGNGDGVATYPPGNGTRWHWGFGAQVGVYYAGDNGLNLGASIKTPQWFEDFRYRSENEVGLPRNARIKVDLPMVVSVGASYCGFERLLLAMDVRYYDYKNTDGFGDAGFRPDGSLRGIGWSSIVVVNTGAQYQLNDRMFVRLGYTYNQNPIRQSEAFFNLASPLLTQHWTSVGGSYLISECVAMNFAVTHAFENEVKGPLFGSPDPTATAGTESSGWAFALGGTVRY